MRVPYDSLTDEGKRISKRGGRGIFSLFLGCVLSYCGLLLYLAIAPQPNLVLIEIWFAGTGGTTGLGIAMITRHLNRTLPRHQVSERVFKLT